MPDAEYIEVPAVKPISWQVKYGVMIGICTITYMAFTIQWMLNTLGAMAFVSWWLFTDMHREYARIFNAVSFAAYLKRQDDGTLSQDGGLNPCGEDDNDKD